MMGLFSRQWFSMGGAGGMRGKSIGPGVQRVPEPQNLQPMPVAPLPLKVCRQAVKMVLI